MVVATCGISNRFVKWCSSDDEVRGLVSKIEEGRMKAGREMNRRHVAGLKDKLKALSLGLSFLKRNQCLLIYLSLGKQEKF